LHPGIQRTSAKTIEAMSNFRQSKKSIHPYIFSAIIWALLGIGCTAKQEKQLGMLPSAKGDKGEIILVMDSVQWKDKLGDEVRKVFQEDVPGLPQAEPMFTVRFIEPHSFLNILRQHKNVVIITTFDMNTSGSQKLQRNYTKESIEKIRSNEDIFMLVTNDEYANGQLVVNLFSRDQQTMIRHLRENKEKIQQAINRAERARLASTIEKKRKKDLENFIRKQHAFSIKLLDGYKMAKDTIGFTWVRYPDYEFDKNILVAYTQYTSEEQFTLENILRWREQIMQQHTKDPDNPAYYVITESLVPVTARQLSLNGMYAMELRGIWRLKERFVGGPFLSYVVVDQETNRLYYLEGFLSAPGGRKREHIREMETLLHSFKPGA
jgi:hypothetical protein